MSQPKDHWKFEIVGKSIHISCACDPEPTVLRISSIRQIRWDREVEGATLTIGYGKNSICRYEYLYNTVEGARENSRELIKTLASHGNTFVSA